MGLFYNIIKFELPNHALYHVLQGPIRASHWSIRVMNLIPLCKRGHMGTAISQPNQQAKWYLPFNLHKMYRQKSTVKLVWSLLYFIPIVITNISHVSLEHENSKASHLTCSKVTDTMTKSIDSIWTLFVLIIFTSLILSFMRATVKLYLSCTADKKMAVFSKYQNIMLSQIKYHFWMSDVCTSRYLHVCCCIQSA